MFSVLGRKGNIVQGRSEMRGQVDPQSGLFSYVSVEERIPADHPLRRVEAQADAVLVSMSTALECMYAE